MVSRSLAAVVISVPASLRGGLEFGTSEPTSEQVIDDWRRSRAEAQRVLVGRSERRQVLVDRSDQAPAVAIVDREARAALVAVLLPGMRIARPSPGGGPPMVKIVARCIADKHEQTDEQLHG